MGHMTMHRPIAGIVCYKFNRSRAADLHENSGFHLLRRFGNLTAVGFYDAERVPMDMHRVMIHWAEIDETDTHSIAEFSHERLRSREDTRVERENVKVSHLVWIWPHRAGIDPPFAQEKRKVAIHSLLWIARMNHEQPHQ